MVPSDNEEVRARLFQEQGLTFTPATLALFDRATSSGCGHANSVTGPFNCPADKKIYLDLSFFRDLEQRFGAAGDFTGACVIAHEVGHHVHHLLGTSGLVQQRRRQLNKREANRYSVAPELQANLFAGLWAHHNQKINKVHEEGDPEEALNAASAIGDDRQQKKWAAGK